jgi:hypothetical protein
VYSQEEKHYNYMKFHVTKNDILVPTQNSDADETMRDVIGSKQDTSFSGGAHENGPSLVGHAKAGYYHVHSSAKVYPSLSNSITVTTSATAWTLGTIVEIVPANAITSWFDIHWILVHAISATDEYELVLYKGASESEIEIGRIAFVKTAAQSQEGNLPIQIPPQAPNTRISAALASKSGSDTASIKIYYHLYPDIT